MTDNYINELLKIIPKEKIYLNEPMSKHTSIKIGGPAEIFIKTTTVEEIKSVVNFANKNNIPLNVVGNGSNLLVNDEGIKGIVLKPQLMQIEIEHTKVTVGSGVTLGALVQKLMQKELTGLEELACIPGTIGGAIRMNAGAHGKEMKDVVETTTYMDMEGNVKTISNKEHQFEYRSSIFAKEKYIILETTMNLQSGEKQKIKENIERYSAWRQQNQPIDYPNAGSIFKRGENYITAKLIDKCGLKGYKIGGAQISIKHAGFIINIGGATAKDVLELADYVTKQVYDKTGKQIELEIEVM